MVLKQTRREGERIIAGRFNGGEENFGRKTGGCVSCPVSFRNEKLSKVE